MVAPDKAPGFEQHGQDQDSDRDHEDRDLQIGLGGKVGRQGRRDARKQGAGKAEGHCKAGSEGKFDFQALPPARREYVHGIGVSSLRMMPGKHANGV
ncbi:hypothetical protein D3C87_1988390 [compost metagenome]